MAGAVIRTFVKIKVTLLKRDFRGDRLEILSWALLFGVTAVAATIWVSLPGTNSPAEPNDLLVLLFGLWMMGWIIGPLIATGEDRALRPEYFRFVPVSPGQLTTGLFVSSFIGLGAPLTLLAFSSMVVLAAQLGWQATVVAALAAILQLAFTIVLARVAMSLLRRYVHSRFSVILSALLLGGVTAFFCTGWAVFAAQGLPINEVASGAASIFYALPSGWGIHAITAAQNSDWLYVAAPLLGFAVLTVLLKLAWSRLLRTRLTSERSFFQKSSRHKSKTVMASSSPVRVVALKELTSWWRDNGRSSKLWYSLFFSIGICVYPLFANIDFFLLFMGALLAIATTSNTANIYATDGSSLWMTLLIPKAARVDVRGRQIAWLAIIAPAATILTITGVLVTGYNWAWPGALTLLTAALGAGAGVFILTSVYKLVPTNDAHKRSDDLSDQGISWLEFVGLTILLLVLIVPSFSFVVLGAMQNLEWLEWLGIPAGIITGIAYFWWFGRLAYNRLEARGPELLNRMLRDSSAEDSRGWSAAIAAIPQNKRTQISLGMIFGPVIAIQQGVVPIAKKLSSDNDPGIFLALYLPESIQYYVSAIIILLGAVIAGYFMRIFMAARKKASLQ